MSPPRSKGATEQVRKAVILDATTGQLKSVVSGLRSAGVASADGDGGWYVGSWLEGVVHVMSDGRLDPTFRGGVAARQSIVSIAVDGDVVVVSDAVGLEAVDRRSGKRIWTVTGGVQLRLHRRSSYSSSWQWPVTRCTRLEHSASWEARGETVLRRSMSEPAACSVGV